MKKIYKLISFILSFIMTVQIMGVSVVCADTELYFSVEEVISGNSVEINSIDLLSDNNIKIDVDSNEYYQIVLDANLMSQSTMKYATAKLCVYNQLGIKNSGKVHVLITDDNGKWLSEFDTTGNSTLKFGNDHRIYNMYVRYYRYSGNNLIEQANAWSNMGSTVTWNLTNNNSCFIYKKEESGIKKGDINGDGEIDLTDLARIKRYIIREINFTSEQFSAADVNSDGDVNLTDLAKIIRHIIGEIKIS